MYVETTVLRVNNKIKEIANYKIDDKLYNSVLPLSIGTIWIEYTEGKKRYDEGTLENHRIYIIYVMENNHKKIVDVGRYYKK